MIETLLQKDLDLSISSPINGSLLTQVGMIGSGGGEEKRFGGAPKTTISSPIRPLPKSGVRGWRRDSALAGLIGGGAHGLQGGVVPWPAGKQP